MEEICEEIARLNFEDFLWVVFIILSLLNIRGDHDEREFLKDNDTRFKEEANRIFTLTLIITLFIYFYFIIRNFRAFEKASQSQKELFSIKLLGSAFLIAGIICLLFFQVKQTSFVGSPAI